MKKWAWFLVSLVVVFFDQLSKYWATTHLSPYEPHPLFPMINFTLAYNTGAAFSFLSGAGGWHQWFFFGFSLVMSLVLIVWIIRTAPSSYLLLLALSLILGGALGNLVDRFTLGHVVDFIDVYYKSYHWPVFNLADSAICLGAIILLYDLVKHPEK
ncbi:signal peptidase II [Legionella yabuuchiae]|uniref:signal peptidase II n=1 Tax=Legionella yabuuchiae TaxID=376727 RepID=UPI0010547023|nr:signal peptidase II [Legionella yabuuchiae]